MQSSADHENLIIVTRLDLIICGTMRIYMKSGKDPSARKPEGARSSEGLARQAQRPGKIQGHTTRALRGSATLQRRN